MQVSKWIRIFLAIIGSILFLDGLFLAFLNKIHVGTIVPLVLGAFFCLYALFYYHLERFSFTTIACIQFGVLGGYASGSGSLA